MTGQEQPAIGASGVTSARAQFDRATGNAPGAGAAGSRSPAGEAVFAGLDWSAAVGETCHAASIRLEGRRDGGREVLMYDLSGTGLLALHEGAPDGDVAVVHFLSDGARAPARAAYDRVLRSVRYVNRADLAHAGEREVRAEIVDATGFPVAVARRTLWVDAQPERRAEPAPAAAESETPPETVEPRPEFEHEPAPAPMPEPVPVPAQSVPAQPLPPPAALYAGGEAGRFDSVSPEVMRFDFDDGLPDHELIVDEAAFEAARREAEGWRPEPAAPRQAAPEAPPALIYEIHRPAGVVQAEPVMIDRGEPGIAEDDAAAAATAAAVFAAGGGYRVFRPAGAVAGPPPPARRTAATDSAAPDRFSGDREGFRVFRHPAADRAGLAARSDTAKSARPRPRPKPNALHLADMLEADADANGLRPSGDETAEDFLLGRRRGRDAA